MLLWAVKTRKAGQRREGVALTLKMGATPSLEDAKAYHRMTYAAGALRPGVLRPAQHPPLAGATLLGQWDHPDPSEAWPLLDPVGPAAAVRASRAAVNV